LGSLSRREPGQHVFHIFKGIDTEAFTSFNDTHDGGSRLTTFFRAGKEPISPTEHHRLNAAFACIVADFDEGLVKVNAKSCPAIECVGDGICQFCFRWLDELCFIEPGFEQGEFWFRQSLAEVCTLSFGERCCDALNVKEALDDAHGKFCSNGIVFPGVFKVAMYMSPAVGSSGTIGNYLVELVGSVGLKDSGESFQNLFWVNRMLSVRVIVKDVRIVSVATIDPDVSPVCFSQSLFYDWQSGGVRLKDATLQEESVHSFDNRRKKVGNFFQPATHGGPIYGNTQGCEYLLLPVQWQMQPKFVGGDFGKQTGTRHAFINRLVGLLSSDDLSVAVFAGVLEHDVLDGFIDGLNELNLVRDIEAENFSPD